MKLVIDIDDKVYEDSKKLVEYGFGSLLYVEAIANGTPYEERAKGEWIVNTGNSYIEPPYFCSECNGSNNWKAPFCEHCGADMRGDI